MDISIVSGTYNRLHSLVRMVESTRQSFVGVHGLNYEIVLVDGGSQDGTIEWCKEQLDIVLIEHGTLFGAVKAFNDGAYAATGEYVILGNDDTSFVEDSVLVAYLYMQSHPDCGIGCFYQDRERQHLSDDDPGKWHVGEMPCVLDNKQVHRPYGQVCIVPKWLGDQVGWWCKEEDFTKRGLKPLHTYGGDNEISSKVYELGFKVSPIPNAKIKDYEIRDDLRKINNVSGGKDPKAVRGYHPDSWAWGKRWQFPDRRDENGRILTGPTIRKYPLMENSISTKHRVVYLPIYEQGWQVQKEQKRGLREALAKVAVVVEYDYVTRYAEIGKQAMLVELMNLMYRIQPTIFLSQLHNGAQINGDDIVSIRQSWPDTKFINWNGDFWPDNLLSEDGIKLAKAFNLQLTVNRDALEKYTEMGVTADYWQIGFEIDGIGCQATVAHDVVFLASRYPGPRKEFVTKLRGLPVNFGLYGSGWPEGWSKGQSMYDFKTACGVYRGAKISIGDSQWPETGFVSNRVFQALAAGGSALAHQWFRDMELLGLIDGETCIIWRDFSELQKKIKYYLTHEDERKRIALAGEKLALEKHSFDVRVQELLVIVDKDKAVVEEGWRW